VWASGNTYTLSISDRAQKGGGEFQKYLEEDNRIDAPLLLLLAAGKGAPPQLIKVKQL
jgi:hypothetical protein